MLAWKTNGNVPVMARILRHKNWKSTQKYVHMVESLFKEEDFDITAATTAEEILALGKTSWQKYDEATIAGVTMHFYKRPKRFGGFQNTVDKSEKTIDKFLSPTSGDISRPPSSFFVFFLVVSFGHYFSIVSREGRNVSRELGSLF